MTASGGTTTPIYELEHLYAGIDGKQRNLTNAVLVLWVWVGLVINVWLLFLDPASRGWHEALRYVDWAVAALLAISIWWRWLRFRIGRRYLRSRWWELPALVPLAIPHATESHLVMWIVLLARFVRVVDRTDNYLGDSITRVLVQHFADPIVDVIKRPITVAVLDEVIAVIEVGDYAGNVRAALDENRAEIEAMVLQLVKEDRTAGRLKLVPFHDDLVNLVSDTVLRIVEGALEDPRTSELISDAIRNSANQLRHAIRSEHA